MFFKLIVPKMLFSHHLSIFILQARFMLTYFFFSIFFLHRETSKGEKLGKKVKNFRKREQMKFLKPICLFWITKRTYRLLRLKERM